MKRIIVLIISSWLCASCSSRQAADDKTIYVSILPLKSIIQDIVGEDLNVEVLVPAGASPETFEPTPKQFVRLNRAKLVFSIGLIDFEKTLLDKINDKNKVVPLCLGIKTIEGSCSHVSTTSDHNHAHGVDPHIWTSPKALLIMASNAFNAIHKLYPDSVKYRSNYEQLILRLHELDNRVREKINRSGIKYFIVYHPALTYFARDYGIRQVAIEADGKEPSARRLAAIIRDARMDGVHKILYQNQFPASVVEVIARDMKAQYIEFDPLDEQVINNIDRITDLITEP